MNFDSIPSNARVPFAYVEINGDRAQQGPSIMEYRALIIGNKLAHGTKSELEVISNLDYDKSLELFGKGSVISKMIKSYKLNNKTTKVDVIAIDDKAAGVAATGEILFAGTATESKPLNFYIAGEPASILVEAGKTAAEIATLLVAEITASEELMISAAVDGVIAEKVNLTSKHKGEFGNKIDLRFDVYGEELPKGVTFTKTALSNGAGNPDVSEIFASLGDVHYNIFAHPYSDAANLNAMDLELEDRFGPLRQIDGYHFSADNGTHAEITTLCESRNSKFSVIIGTRGASSPWDYAAAAAGQVCSSAQIDPARPFQRLSLKGIKLPTQKEKFNWLERNSFLHSGVATFNVLGNVVQAERFVTTYRKNSAGAADTAFLDLNTLLTLSYLRYDYRNTMLRKFSRHKLANDGQRFGSGQKIITPKIAKAEALAIFRNWEELGLVENVDQFKEDLIIERPLSDVNRLDTLMSPDLVNQLRVLGTQIQFLL